MKVNTILILAVGAMGVNAQAKEITDLSTCGKFCVSSMFGKAGEFGCQPTDASCFCKDARFMNGVVDCSRESCAQSSDADQAIQFAVEACSKAGVAVQGGGQGSGQGGNGDSGATGAGQATPAPEATGTGAQGDDSGGVVGGAIPISTSTGVTVVEENGTKVTKTIESTIMSQPTGADGAEGTDGAGGAEGTDGAGGAEGTDGAGGAGGAGSSSGAGDSRSTTTTDGGAASSTEDAGGFAHKAAAPAAGLLAAAGLAVFLI